MRVTLLDYGAGNVRSIRNALDKLGVEVVDVAKPEDISKAEMLIFPGVGSFGPAMEKLQSLGVVDALKAYLSDSTRPFFGICIGMQVLFEGSSEAPGVEGLGVFKGRVERFETKAAPVPHIGWNGAFDSSYYFVHSFRVSRCDDACALTTYADETFVSAVRRRAQCAVQFHPEKSGEAGLRLLRQFIQEKTIGGEEKVVTSPLPLARRIVCALDVRTNDDGDLVVTKGDGYDVREKSQGNNVRNLGKPVKLCKRYYDEGADEIAILNICAFKGETLGDLPLLQVLRQASTECFVPLTIGGGIRGYKDSLGNVVTALEVASAYFRAGADKVSIGSDAVYAALSLDDENREVSSIEQISEKYGAQAVVVSIDPKRVYVENNEDACKKTVVTQPDGRSCWYQCTVSGGRKCVDLDAVELARAVEKLGAGEIMLNCIDCDGKKQGFDVALLKAVKSAVGIPVIASSGAGSPNHFVKAFQDANVDAALAAGIFHRHEVEISDVKLALREAGLPARS